MVAVSPFCLPSTNVYTVGARFNLLVALTSILAIANSGFRGLNLQTSADFSRRLFTGTLQLIGFRWKQALVLIWFHFNTQLWFAKDF